ncbi:helix-hairpin-helix domain-containing protein [Pedomonas mirosovicensis]|uniref:helix-hairpin-helix domain-containing protein n=1 Tax=Pedomonas mirosovicensis TaxID=2908641 RepID=UPI002169E9D2|nr:hypothetical protein [Pedomonas mirosovicensis]MCH8683716.1 hypothetical protein [Pedomonas mirosovicensis]
MRCDLGLRMIDGLSQNAGQALVEARREGLFRTVEELRRRSGLPVDALEKLAAADAFRSLGHDRRQAHVAVRSVPKAKPLPLFEHVGEVVPEPTMSLPDMALAEETVVDPRAGPVAEGASHGTAAAPLCRPWHPHLRLAPDGG